MIASPLQTRFLAAAIRLERQLFFKPWTEKQYVRFLARPGSHAAQVADCGGLVGCSFFRLRGPYGSQYFELVSLVTRGSRRGEGHGRALVDYVRALGLPVRTWVNADNKGALRFYEREGFTVARRALKRYGKHDAVRVLWTPAAA